MLRHYPKTHVFALVAVSVFLGLILLAAPSKEAEADRITPATIDTGLKEPEVVQAAVDAEPDSEAVAMTVLADQPDEPTSLVEPVVEEPNWHRLSIKKGDNLTAVFKRAGLTARDVYEVSQAAKRESDTGLHKLYPGQEIALIIENGALQRLKYSKNALESVEFVRGEVGYTVEKAVREPEIRARFISATLEDSLFLSSSRAGIPDKLIMELAHVFGGVIDFIYDPRKGDTFSVVFEEKYLDGKLIGTGHILAAEFTNSGDQHIALRYADTQGDTGYYSPEGVSMHKAFLRAPLDFTRISDDFNPRRMHPIHKKIKAHNGTDYVAPRGTPVLAAGAGKVIKSGYSAPNGNYVFIQHGERYVTKYIHLNKRSVKTGDRVKQGQTIGQVGSTGWATGPHLHYEFLVDGVHRNPRSVLDKLPKAKTLKGEELDRFKASTQTQLASLQPSSTLAYKDQ